MPRKNAPIRMGGNLLDENLGPIVGHLEEMFHHQYGLQYCAENMNIDSEELNSEK